MLLEYRLALESDAQQLSFLFQTVYIETYGTEGVSKEFSNFIVQQFSVERLLSIIRSTEHHLWIATFKNNPVGVLQLDHFSACPIGNFQGHEINKIYILKRFYGLGIGQELMALAEGALRQMHANRVWLWVLESNTRAIQFYEKQGFETIGTAAFQMEVNCYTNTVMQKHL